MRTKFPGLDPAALQPILWRNCQQVTETDTSAK